jgi:hypothetical protein
MLTRVVAPQRSKRRSRKQRQRTGAPRAVPSDRREQRAERETVLQRQSRQASRTLGTVGERPPSPFGGLPISELAILIGGIGTVVGVIDGGSAAMIVGAVVCALGVLEVTAREHLSGFRSHSSLLAGFPAVGLEALIVALFGVPKDRPLLLVPVIPVYGICFWLLRRTFERARHARVARPPAP